MTRSRQVVAAGEGFVVCDVRCHAPRPAWSPPEVGPRYVLVFVRAGAFCRRVSGRERFMDAVSAYFDTPGGEQQIAHAGPDGDRCTAIELGEDLAGVLADDDPARIGEPKLTPVDAALAVQLLTRQAGRADPFEVAEMVIRLVSAAISGPGDLPPPRHARTQAAWRRLSDGTKQLLGCDRGASLRELARQQSVSPHHLSRVFHACTGKTVSAYRNQLRVREALERLAEGERSLTGLASDLGFADHAHLTRTMQREAGAVPSVLRRLLTAREPCFSAWARRADDGAVGLPHDHARSL